MHTPKTQVLANTGNASLCCLTNIPRLFPQQYLAFAHFSQLNSIPLLGLSYFQGPYPITPRCYKLPHPYILLDIWVSVCIVGITEVPWGRLQPSAASPASWLPDVHTPNTGIQIKPAADLSPSAEWTGLPTLHSSFCRLTLTQHVSLPEY